ncbi:bile acid:sodium symporter family protein [Sphingobium algorifonticola]|uniref:Bile acid:sodium symporter n=1 Tax=Sphingobium algorifonticola TaxID=2008318 RepID=A0A437J7B8_9SPHN|nr:bile acid:sodium symporter family protein [Sphingobium algorifonticola]RVT41083.1 bile acid:sodium symporter [Sphingobium algorifonticola]
MKTLRAVLDPFVLLLIAMVVLASWLPVEGEHARITDRLADAGIVMLFFLHGARLSRAAIAAGASNWRLQGAVLLVTFGLFPLLGIGIATAMRTFGADMAVGDPVLAGGMLFLTLLPSTVQSSIAFTSIARGNLAGAVCAASFSNFAGIVLTPLLVGLTMASSSVGQGSIWHSAETIALQLLLPFVAGHLARPLIGSLVERHKRFVGRLDRAAILLIVYTAFSAAVVDGLWQRLSLVTLAMLSLICAGLLALVLAASWRAGIALGFSRADRIVLLFCGSKKSLASGVPMAGALFPAAQVGMLLVPLMLFHQFQLIACALIARRLAAQDGASRDRHKDKRRMNGSLVETTDR